MPSPPRARLPDVRPGLNRRLTLGDHTFYLTASIYPDGRVGELFVRVANDAPPVERPTLSGLLDALAIAISIGLQHGVPLERYVDKFEGQRFEPAGMAVGPNKALSVVDGLARWLRAKFLAKEDA